MPQLAIIRGLRVPLLLRPLNASKAFKGLRDLINELGICLEHMPTMFCFVAYIYYTFGILGVNQFEGDMYNRCRSTEEPVNGVWPIEDKVKRLCTVQGYGEYYCPGDTVCGNPDLYNLPMEGENISDSDLIHFGAIGFDNPAVALLTVFQCSTMEGWNELMYQMEDAENSIFSPIYFHIMVYITSYFALNLILAQIIESFAEAKKEEKEEKEEKGGGEEKEEKKILEKEDTPNTSPHKKKEAEPEKKEEKQLETAEKKDGKVEEKKETETPTGGFCQSNAFTAIIIACILGNMIVLSADRYPISSSELAVWDNINTAFFAIFWLETVIKIISMGFKEYFWDKYNILDTAINIYGIIEIGLTYSYLRNNYDVNVIIVLIRLSRLIKIISKWRFLEEMLTLFFMP